MENIIKSLPSELYTREYYLENCGGAVDFSTDAFTLRIAKCLEYVNAQKDDKILDIGCGRGEASVYMAIDGAEVVGVDYSEDSITISEETKKRFSDKIKGSVSFERGNAKSLQFSDNSFDKIIMLDVVEHLYEEELKIALKECFRVLKPHGKLFVHTLPNRLTYNYIYPLVRLCYPLLKIIKPFKNLLNTNPYWRELGYLPKNPRNPHEKQMHVLEMSPKQLKGYLEEAGFNTKIHLKFQLRTDESVISKIGSLIEKTPLIKELLCIDIIAVGERSGV